MGHLEDNLGATNIDISPDDHARLDALAEPERATVPYYHGNMVNFAASEYAWI